MTGGHGEATRGEVQTATFEDADRSVYRAPNGNAAIGGHDEVLAFLALGGLRGIGYWTLYKAARAGVPFSHILRAGSREAAVEILSGFGARLSAQPTGASWLQLRDSAMEKAFRTIESLHRAGIQVLLQSDPYFPPSLLQLVDPPEWLFVRGSTQVLQAPSVAVVGTRSPSADGLWLANAVGASFSLFNAPTVSGLATGIDQIVHEWSLRAGVPTVAVLGTGIFTEFPKGSNSLANKIVEAGGAVVTEYLPQDSFSGENFVRRNRLQAALARVVIPVEWAPRSGTAHTVSFAVGLGRPIAGLRLPDWAKGRVVLPEGAETLARVFSMPGEEDSFRSYIHSALAGDAQFAGLRGQQPPQLNLF